ncbi:MAG: hypothetical protein ABIN36_08030 [Ferruginibacter sp.]
MNKTFSASIEAIQTAIKTLNTKGIKPTQKNVQVETGLSLRTVKTYWARVQSSSTDEGNRVQGLPIEQDKRVQVSPDRVQGSKPHKTKRVQSSRTPLERLQRRTFNQPMEIFPYKPWLK